MAVYRRPARQRFVLLVLTLLSVTIITLDQRGQAGGVFDDVRGFARDAFAPVQSAADTVLSPVGDFVGGIVNYGDLEAENERLREEVAALRTEVEKTADIRREREDLLELNELPFAEDIPAVTANVVNVSPSNFDLTVELNKGTSSGLAKDMPVVANGGLVGRVVEVSRSRAVVLLLTDPTFAVGVRLGPTGDIGTAEGKGVGRDLVVNNIDPKAEVKRGDVMLTSGLQASQFPAGIPVGKVASTSKSAGALQQSITLEPLADLPRLAIVRVLQFSPGDAG